MIALLESIEVDSKVIEEEQLYGPPLKHAEIYVNLKFVTSGNGQAFEDMPLKAREAFFDKFNALIGESFEFEVDIQEKSNGNR